MKKSLIALAVAGAFAAPAFAASSNVDVYGTLRFSVDHNSRNNGSTDNWTINDQISRIGFKGSEDLGGGLKAVWQIEQQIASATAPTTAGGAFGDAGLRNTFVGVAGGFGTAIIGRHDTPYKLGGSADLFADTSADSQRAGAGGIIGRNGFDNRISGTIAYISPDWSGFHFAAALVPGEGTTTGSANGLADAYSLVGVYANGPLKMTLGHESFGKELGNVTATAASTCTAPSVFVVGSTTTCVQEIAGVTTFSAPVAGATTTTTPNSDKSATKFNIGYKIGDVALGYTYERSDANYTSTTKDVSQLASVAYGMGPITLAAQYGKFNDKQATDADLTRWTVGAIYNLSKRTNVYAAYNSDNYKVATTVDTKTITMGVNTSF
ncbi:MAG: porin [Pseudomonadota bacterium]|nr:porin [Pseudomonadota bacterium]